jgi:hypothetical protein
VYSVDFLWRLARHGLLCDWADVTQLSLSQICLELALEGPDSMSRTRTDKAEACVWQTSGFWQCSSLQWGVSEAMGVLQDSELRHLRSLVPLWVRSYARKLDKMRHFGISEVLTFSFLEQLAVIFGVAEQSRVNRDSDRCAGTCMLRQELRTVTDACQTFMGPP